MATSITLPLAPDQTLPPATEEPADDPQSQQRRDKSVGTQSAAFHDLDDQAQRTESGATCYDVFHGRHYI